MLAPMYIYLQAVTMFYMICNKCYNWPGYLVINIDELAVQVYL